jgi:hypothetical protein
MVYEPGCLYTISYRQEEYNADQSALDKTDYPVYETFSGNVGRKTDFPITFVIHHDGKKHGVLYSADEVAGAGA